jgi:transposase InsO family protein
VLNVKVARDKETGQLRAMTAQEEAELKQNAKAIERNALEVARPTTTTVYHADGRMTGKLSPEVTESLHIVRAQDGTMVITHDEAAAATPAPKAEAPTE